MASRAESVRAMYSASVDERAMVGCRRDFHDTGELPKQKMNPVVDLQSSHCSAQSESEWPVRVISGPPSVMVYSDVSLAYTRTRCAARQ